MQLEERVKCSTLSPQAPTEKKLDELEKVTADLENVGTVDVTIYVGLLGTTNDDVAGNQMVSFCTLMFIDIFVLNLH